MSIFSSIFGTNSNSDNSTSQAELPLNEIDELHDISYCVPAKASDIKGQDSIVYSLRSGVPVVLVLSSVKTVAEREIIRVYINGVVDMNAGSVVDASPDIIIITPNNYKEAVDLLG